MTPFRTLSAAGFAATAITYGPARMGFGLFLPQFKPAFSMSTGTAGLISSLGFLCFVLALLVSQFMTSQRGARLPVICGLIAATAGLAIIAAAPNLPVLCLGVILAMSSAGLSWTPFNAAVHCSLDDATRPAALSLISTGTSVGIVVAGASALLLSASGISWRLCWAAFALASAGALLANWAALRSAGTTARAQDPPRSIRDLVQPIILPLLGTGLCFGTTSAIYITFAADRIAGAEGSAGLPAGMAAGLIFVVYGVCGLAGLFTGRVKRLINLAWLLRGLMGISALSLALIALAPASWVAIVLSAGLQGVFVMMTSAVLAFWCERLFPSLPSVSFTLALLVAGTGSVIGPAVAGFISDALGWIPMFLGAAALPGAAAFAIQPGFLQERPAPA